MIHIIVALEENKQKMLYFITVPQVNCQNNLSKKKEK